MSIYIVNSFNLILINICKARNNQSKSNKPWGWKQLTLLKSSTWTPTSWEVSTVIFLLFSFRFRKAIHHSTKGYSPCYQQKRHHCPGPIRNWKDRHLLYRCPSFNRSKVSPLSSHYFSSNQRTCPTNQQSYLLFQWILESQHQMLYRRNWSKRRQKNPQRRRCSSRCRNSR